MPKIPTFRSGQTEMTTQTASVTSNIQIDPRLSIASALLPAANAVTDYAVKKRDATEKLQAQKVILDLKSEADKIIYSQKDNIDEEESVNTFSKGFNPLVTKTINNQKNRRIKKLIQDGMILENAENIYKLKTQSFEAFEKESVKIYNDTQASNIGKYKTADNKEQKNIAANEMIRAAETYNDAHQLGKNDLKKRVENIKNALFVTDAESLIGTDGGAEAIKSLDTGEGLLNNEVFSKTMYSVYSSKIESLTIKGDPNADFEKAEELLIEMEKFERSNGHKIVDDGREKTFGTLKQKVLTEKIGHDDLMFQIEQGKTVADYSNAQKTSLGGAFYNPMIMEKSGATAKALSNEAKAEYDIRYDEYLNVNSDASPFEKQQFSLELNLMLVDKYNAVTIEQLSTFNLDRNKFNVRRERIEISSLKALYQANPKLPNKLKSLAKLNGYVDDKGNADVNAFLNVYEQVIKSRTD